MCLDPAGGRYHLWVKNPQVATSQCIECISSKSLQETQTCHLTFTIEAYEAVQPPQPYWETGKILLVYENYFFWLAFWVIFYSIILQLTLLTFIITIAIIYC